VDVREGVTSIKEDTAFGEDRFVGNERLWRGRWFQTRAAKRTTCLSGRNKLRCAGGPSAMRVETEREEDGRRIAEVPELPGVMVYAETREEAVTRVEALALRVIADRLDHGDVIPELDELFAVSA